MRGAVALLAVVVAGMPAAPAAAAPPPTASGGVVTLISGDRLRISPDGRTAGRVPSPGRDGVPLITRFAGGRLRVVPADAVPLLAADRLDPRLFDVTGLVEAGHAARGELPLIVTADDPATVAAAIGGPARDLATIRSTAVRVPVSATATLWQRLTTGSLRTAYRKVWLDGMARLSTDVSVPLVGAPAAWAAGYTGGEVPVGVLDTGVDADHPDLAGVVAGSADFTAAGDGLDRAGHGTHVASVIAGSGAASAGRYRGMAPDVRLYSGKVCEPTGCSESAVLAGMQWAARDQGLRVVNLSLGRPDEPGIDLLEAAIDTLTATYGTLFVVAAGNDRARVWSPASADAALAVGASDERDAVTRFSGPGDLVAPGVAVTAARSGDSPLPGDAYTTLSGSSTAAPHVTGAAAILAQQHPDWPPARIKAALTGSATPLVGDSADRSGGGRLDVANAVASPVRAEPAALSFDADDRPGVRAVTYHNTGTTPVTLALSAPDRFTADASAVTVPAHGSASVRVTARPGTARRTGLLTATGGDVAVHTTLAVARPTHTLTLRFTDRTGVRSTRALATAYRPDGTTATGASLSLPPGTYALDAQVLESDGGITLLHRPSLVLDRDTTVDLDARLGRPVPVAAPGRPGYGHLAVTMAGGAGTGLQDVPLAGVTAAQVGPGGTGALPLSVVRFERRSATSLGFAAHHEVPGTRLTSLDLEVSYDDGKSWQTPLFARVGERGVVILRPGRLTVSLRVTAVNSAGSTVSETMLGAYRAE